MVGLEGSGSGLDDTEWRAIIRRIEEGKLTPFIGDGVVGQFLPGMTEFIPDWAKAIGYPFGTSLNVTRLAQYLSIRLGEEEAKEEFLHFSKEHVRKSAQAAVEGRQADGEGRGSGTLSGRISEVVTSMGFPEFQDTETNPFHTLAQLPLPIYVTTSYYDFMERALTEVGKKPRSEYCRWHDKLEIIDEEEVDPYRKAYRLLTNRFNMDELERLCFDLNIDFEVLAGDAKDKKALSLIKYVERHDLLGQLVEAGQAFRADINWAEILADEDVEPTVETPLVYHLHGIDENPASLVLTEDNYLDFLLKVSRDQNAIPLPVSRALVDSSLLLLGYHLHDWDFRVLFRGLIDNKRQGWRKVSLAIQLSPEDDSTDGAVLPAEAQKYLEKYFDKANFKIYWGRPQNFVQELWDHWKNKS